MNSFIAMKNIKRMKKPFGKTLLPSTADTRLPVRKFDP